MLRDRIFKVFCIAGILIITLIHFIAIQQDSWLKMIAAGFFFILVASLMVKGSVTIILKLRQAIVRDQIFYKIALLIVASVMFSMLVLFTSSVVWHALVEHRIDTDLIFLNCMHCSGIIIFLAIIYEILFLTKERDLDYKVVKHLDNELANAEINILKNELDPHFVYNSLMPLYYLIKNDVSKAESFTHKLMQVYQHFLEKRKHDFVTLEEEMEFIRNYLFLLRIRFRDSIYLTADISPDAYPDLVIPFSLQLLLENAIKHNEISKENPLHIQIRTEPNTLVVSNSYKVAEDGARSNKIGLNNLRARYRILSKKNITVIKTRENFIVRLPLIRNVKQYDVHSNYRR